MGEEVKEAPKLSLSAKAMSVLLHVYKWRHSPKTMEEFNKLMERSRKNNEKPYTLSAKLKSSHTVEHINSIPVYHLKGSKECDRVVIYLHGGGYFEQIRLFHWLAIDKLVQGTTAELIVPIYPLVPAHTFHETYDLLIALYQQVLEHYTADQIIFTGDSAGGGLAASFTEHLSVLHLPLPKRLILLSPWVNPVSSNPNNDKYRECDPMLAGLPGKQVAMLWAGEKVESIDAEPQEDSLARDYRICPINGNLAVLPECFIFAGSHEILCPDAILFHQRLTEAGVKSTLHIGEGLPHDYYILPITEGKEILVHICNIINM